MIRSNDVLLEIRRILQSELEFAGEVRPEDELLKDLQLDSYGLIVLGVGLENRFRVKIPQERAFAVRTAADLCQLICALIVEQSQQERGA